MYNLLFTQLFPYIKPYKYKAIGAVILSVLIALIGGAQVKLVKPIFDKGLSPDGTLNEALILAGSLVALSLLHFPCRFFHFYWVRFIVDRATCQLRLEIFQKLQKLPSSFYSQSKQGNLISNILNDTHIFSGGFKAALDLIREPLKAIVFLSMAMWADWQLTLVIFIIAPFLAAIFAISGKKVKNNQKVVQAEQAELTHNIAEGISAHKITKAFNLQEYVGNRFKSAQNKFFNAQMRTTFIEEMAHPFVEVVGGIAFGGVIVFGHYRITSGTITVGDFIAFVAALALFMDPMRKFSQASVKVGQAKAAAERIFSLLNMQEEIDEGHLQELRFSKSIQVKNVTFSYGEGNVIENLNLEINKGEKVALVGLSGSGKSTLINLLLGLYPIEHGEILIDGQPIQSLKLKALRNLFSLVSQDIFLFNDSIKENLSLGQELSPDKFEEALKVAYADEFIDKLPSRVDTMIGDRGTRLSGGQQQRITIARAFLQNTPVFLFDEATSALDNESEKVVQKALDQLAADKTVVAVAHRLSTIQNFDRIYVMQEGHLVEQGTHQELLNKKGEYFKLYQVGSH